DTTYLSIIVAPIMFYLVHSATREHRLKTIALLAAVVAYCIYVAFLQEFSYIVLFLGLYALWRSVKGNHESLIALAAGMTAGLVIGVPRLVAQYQTLSDTPRISTGVVFDGDLFTLLRFFSRDIYGRSYAESLTGSSVNLYEGDLLFVAAFASLLLVAILIDRGRHARTPWNSLRRTDIGFLLAYIVFVFATMHVQLVYRAVSLLYANAPFQHSRIGVSALLPIACLSALYLRRRHQRQLNLASWLTIAVALALVVSATTFDYESWRDPILNALGQPSAPFIACDACMKLKQTGQFLAVDVIRLVVLAVLFVLLATSWRWLRWFSADGVRTALALAITFQAVWGANAWLTGPDTTEYATPFDGNNMVLAPPGDFAHPTADEMQQLQSRLDNREYRSITVCPLDVIVVDCSNPMGILWNLRLLDGYLSGVPRRLGELPWQPNEVSSHQIRFRQATDVPWRLMSLLNVKNAIVVTPDLYTNAGSHLPDGLQIVENPSPYVYPRAYFARTVESVSEAEDVAVTHDFFAECRQCDNLLEAPKPVDEVEGPVTGAFDASGDVAVLDGADRIDLTFPASAHPRFLVLNEPYARGWSASADDQDLAIYPTNVVMRGVLVPTGATHVTFAYHSFLQFAGWYTLGLLGFATLAYLLISRFSRHRPPLPLGEVARSAGEG
ncbi:MAG: hypothetical protein JO352_39340, partial [Chloroflexi bacterium]|nr:hypothetical protein [Chloroflexota bacterium]